MKSINIKINLKTYDYKILNSYLKYQSLESFFIQIIINHLQSYFNIQLSNSSFKIIK